MAKRDSNTAPSFDLERVAFRAGQSPVAGVDEAGRGPWAGPVVAAAVILDPQAIPAGLNDSKALSPARREELYEQIKSCADVGIAIGDVERINRSNILNATMWAMATALSNLSATPALALIDGNRKPQAGITCQTIIKGDATSLSIAAASIMAKVTRDRLMSDLDANYPGYGFARHKGYGTAWHSDMLRKLGPCPAHRRTFAPIRALLDSTNG
jgi:ribonuclease HII